MNQAADERSAVAAAVATLLAALTLSPLVQGRTWLIVAALVVVAVMVTGIVVRQLVSWWPIVVGGQVVVLVVGLTLLFARGDALAGVIPGPETVDRFRGLVDSAMAITREQRPPVESSQGIVLLVVAAMGLVAIAVDLLAASVRQPALAGLPLLAVYCVPAALLPGGLPWYYFVPAAAGFLLLLSADAGDRVRAWGRVLSAPAPTGVFTRTGNADTGLARGGRRVGVAAVLVAAIIPAIVPGLGDRLLNDPAGRGTGGGGDQELRTLNPILTLTKDLTSGDTTPLITYRTQVDNPEPLRIVTAEVYNGQRWSPGQPKIPGDQTVRDGLPPAPGLSGRIEANPVSTQIDIRGLNQTYLPLPYPTLAVENLRGNWLYDRATLNVVGQGITTRGLSYTAQHLQVKPTAEQLGNAGEPPASLGPYRTIPRDLPPEIIRTAQEVTKNADTDFAQAVLLQNWFRDTGGFEYSTDAPDSTGQDAIKDFLEQKRGYCIHFAGAMALMARALGIPARVGVGFLPGTKDGDQWVITAKDAHAWPELYFEGVGWVRFEPTPRTDAAASTRPPSWTVPNRGQLPGDDETAVPSTAPSVSAAPTGRAAQRPEEKGSTTPEPSFADRLADLPWRTIAVVLVLLAVLVSPQVADRLTRRRRWRRATTGTARTEAAWDELRLRLSDAGVRWATSWTPRALQRRLIGDLRLGGSEQAAMGRLVADLEAARYAPPEDAPGRERDALMRDVKLVVAAAEEVLPTRTKLLTRLFPPSGIRAIRDVVQQADESASTAGRRVTDRAAGIRESVGSARGRGKPEE
jgi:transglutaminase-like putative cysteine protease